MSHLLARLLGRVGGKVLVIAHRGSSGHEENTARAFDGALAAGADGLELDVRPCASGELVVCHDPDLQRVAGRDDLVADLSLAQLQAIPLLDSDQHLLSLAEVFERSLPRCQVLNVELKPNGVEDLQAAADTLVAAIASLPRPQRSKVLVSTFGRRAVSLLRGRVPRLGFLFETDQEQKPWPKGITALHPRSDFVTEQTAHAWRRYQLNPWTINDPAEALRLAKLGVNAIITDEVATMRQRLTAAGY